MSEELLVLGGLACILLVTLMLRICKRSKPGPTAKAGPGARATRRTAPPPLPARTAPSLPPRNFNIRALDYPKCPIDRSRNEPGKPQVIFWDREHNCYTCCHGHRFTGRE